MTAGLTKFSLAISSMFSCWRWRFQEQGAGDFGIHPAQTERGGGGVVCFHFIDTTLVTPALEGGGQKDVEDFDGQFGRGGSRAEAEDIGVVMLAAERSRGLVGDQRGAHAGDFVGRNADADPRRAHQQSKLAFLRRHLLADRMAEIGVIAGFLVMRA